jgi:hypothetical protein
MQVIPTGQATFLVGRGPLKAMRLLLPVPLHLTIKRQSACSPMS